MQTTVNCKAHACFVVLALALLTPFQLVGGPLFRDNFTEGLQPHWNPVGEAAESGLAKPASVLVTGKSAWTDYRVSVQMRVVEQNDVIGLVFGYQSKGNYYRLVLDRPQGSVRLENAVNGVVDVLAQESFAFDDTVRYGVEASLTGAGVEVTIDGISMFRVADPSHNSGAVGLYSQAPLESWGDVWSRFDAVKVMQANEDAFDAVNVMQANEAGAELEPPGAPAGEILAFDWNQLVKTSIGRNIEGITPYKPNNQPVRNNFNWVTAPNYAGGTYQFRVLIRKLSKPDAFKFIFNHWEWVPQSGGGTKLAEAVLVHPSNLSFNYTGQPIVRTFSQSIPALKSMHTVNPVKFAPWTWTIPRHLVGFFAPGSSAPLSNQLSSAALPVDMRMTVVAVAAGQTFSGWGSSTNQTFWYKHTK